MTICENDVELRLPIQRETTETPCGAWVLATFWSVSYTVDMFLRRRLVPRTLLLLFTLALAGSMPAQARDSKWRKAPKPKFPKEALNAFVEGSVTVRAIMAPNGSVSIARVAKSSGDTRLDEAAVRAVLKWEMDPKSLQPSDQKEGCAIVFDFRQEAMPGAVYRDRAAWFAGEAANPWVFAPFPAYPETARRCRREGTVRLEVTIGHGGVVSDVKILESSGYPDLDNAAVTAVRHYRAHKQYEGTQGRFPITFDLSHRR